MGQDTRRRSVSIGDSAPTYDYEVTAEAIARFYRSARYENIVYANSPPSTEGPRGQLSGGSLPATGTSPGEGKVPSIAAPAAMALVYAPVRTSWPLPDGSRATLIPDTSADGTVPTVEVEIEFQGELVVPGDVISSVTSVQDQGEQDGNNYLVLRVTAHNQRDDLVARISCTYRWRSEPAPEI